MQRYIRLRGALGAVHERHDDSDCQGTSPVQPPTTITASGVSGCDGEVATKSRKPATES